MLKIVVDTNIIFSLLLGKNSKYQEIIFNNHVTIFTSNFLIIELFKHKDKIIRYSQLEEDEYLEMILNFLEKINIIKLESIPINIKKEAYQLTKNVDPKDFIFIAIALYIKGKLWTGDKALLNSLPSLCINTNDIWKLLNFSGGNND